MRFDRRLLALLHSHKTLLFLTILLGFTGGLLTVAQARLLSRVIDQVFLGGQNLSSISNLLVGLLILITLRAALVWVGESSAGALAGRIKLELRRQLIEKILTLGPGYARGERTGELANTFIEGIEGLDAYFRLYLPQVILAALVPLTFLALIFPLDPLSAIILLVTAPLIPLFMVLIGNLAEALTRRQWTSLSRLSAHFLDILQGLTTLKLLGRSRAQARVVAQVGESYRQVTMKVLRVTFLSALALEMIATLSTAIVAVEIGLRLLYGRLTFEQAFFVLLLAPEFYLPLRSLGARFHAGMGGVAAAGRIFAILENAEETVTSHSLSDTSDQLPVLGPIRFENVSYTYPDGRHALKDASFELRSGEKTALVGLSGAGKSTVAALLLRFQDPQRGRILIDGQSLDRIPVEDWREQVAWVPQAPFLFNGTIAENIRLGRDGASEAEVVDAARLANAYDFIEKLPSGYQTMIGERGARLSGGQAQRVALARAFLKDAPLLILDEATANLDPELEDRVQESLERLASGRTVLVIAHRLNTIIGADRIVALQNGQVAESGTYTELIQTGGLFSQLVAESLNLSNQANPRNIPDQPEGPALLPKPFVEKPPQAGGRPGTPPASNNTGSDLAGFFGSRSRSPFMRLLQLIAPNAGLVALSVLLGFATIGSGIGLMSTSAYLISRAALQPSIAELQVAIVGVRFFGISRGAFRYLERIVSHQVTFQLLTRLRTRFYQALEPLAPARLLQYGGGDLLSRITGDIAALESFYVRGLAPPLVALLVGLAMFIFMAFYDLRLAASLVIVLLFAGLGLPLLAYWLARTASRKVVLERTALSALVVDGIQGLADLLAFGQAGRHLKKVEAASQNIKRSQDRLANLGGLTDSLGLLLANLGMWLVLVVAIPLVSNGQLDGVSLAVLTLAALASFEAVQPLPAAAQQLEGNLAAARRLFELVDTEPEVRDPVGPVEIPAWEVEPGVMTEPVAGAMKTTEAVNLFSIRSDGFSRLRQSFDLEVRGVTFQYVDSPSPPRPPSPAGRRGSRDVSAANVPAERWGSDEGISDAPHALEDVSFNLPLGKRLAVVGPSGAGKSTLVNLLLRFWEIQAGEITLGGLDLRRYSQEAVRKQFAVVTQNTHLFNTTVRENLLLARPKATEQELRAAAKAAKIHDFILSLPDGYETWIGESGLRLSGGERQRLAMARALLKGAPVLLLDEPTANLDAHTSRKVQAELQSLMAGRSTLLITHQLSGLEVMDEILVLREGRVVERGTQAELLQQSGLFQRMWKLQNQNLEETLG